jgi:hypothetical protein
MTLCHVNVAGLECGQPVAGRIHWSGENWSDEACDRHLGLFQATTGHLIEWYPHCQIEILDPYSRVDLVECGDLASTKAQWDGGGAVWICGNHLEMLAKAN